MTTHNNLFVVKYLIFKPSFVVILGLRVCKTATQASPELVKLACGSFRSQVEPCKCHWFNDKDSSRAGDKSDSAFHPCSVKTVRFLSGRFPCWNLRLCLKWRISDRSELTAELGTTYISGPSSDRWFCWSVGFGEGTFAYGQVPRWSWCRWSGDHPLKVLI